MIKNKYEVRGDVTAIFIESKKHGEFETLIDTDDLGRVKEAGSWSIHWNKSNESYYVLGKLKENGKWKTVYLHRYIMSVTDRWEIIDHIYHNTLDNRKDFLRVVTQAENLQNLRKRTGNKSGVTGVVWNKREQKWIVRIAVNGKQNNLGYFTNLEQAKQVRLEAEKKLFRYKQSIS